MGLRLDDRRRSVFIGKVAIDGVGIKAVCQFCEQLYRPPGGRVVTPKLRLRRDQMFELEVRRSPLGVVKRLQTVDTFVRNEGAMSHRRITSREDTRGWSPRPPSRGQTTLRVDRMQTADIRVEVVVVANHSFSSSVPNSDIMSRARRLYERTLPFHMSFFRRCLGLMLVLVQCNNSRSVCPPTLDM